MLLVIVHRYLNPRTGKDYPPTAQNAIEEGKLACEEYYILN